MMGLREYSLNKNFPDLFIVLEFIVIKNAVDRNLNITLQPMHKNASTTTIIITYSKSIFGQQTIIG